MPPAQSIQQLATPRRTDRQITDEETIKALLTVAEVGYLATSIDEQPFINPNLFWYDGERIFFHTARKGRTRTNIEANPKVCFTVAERGRYLPAKTAMGFSVEYASVVVFGRARVLEDNAEKTYALQGLLDKYFGHLKPGKDYRPITEAELDSTSVFAVEIDAASGKRKTADPDFPTEGPLRAFYSPTEENRVK
jgi:nitroimidazol reductase NimA-like FMN-containing flavoprotein (pyridoxamine 5'-phosphate oxidase superfamily)